MHYSFWKRSEPLYYFTLISFRFISSENKASGDTEMVETSQKLKVSQSFKYDKNFIAVPLGALLPHEISRLSFRTTC